jgi:hypothetical protein
MDADKVHLILRIASVSMRSSKLGFHEANRMLGVVVLHNQLGKGLLRDETGRVILFEVETDVTGSFSTFRDVVRDTYLGIDHSENKLICIDQGATTRTMLQVKGPWAGFSILGSAE